MQRDLEAEEDRLFAQQMEEQHKAIVIQDRTKQRGLQDVRKGMDEYNKLKAEEMKKKAFNAYNHTQTYKNEWSAQLIIICMRAKAKVRTHFIFFSHCFISSSFIFSTFAKMPNAIIDASLGPRINFIKSCFTNSSLVFYSWIFCLLAAMVSICRWCFVRLHHEKDTRQRVIVSMRRLCNNYYTFTLKVLASIFLLIDCLLKHGFSFHELDALISPFV